MMELFPYLDEVIADVESILTDSVVENWFRIREVFENLLRENRGDLDYGFLGRFCRALRLPVIEFPMRENGRIAVNPVWEKRVEGYGIKDFTVRVAINEKLSASNKLMALSHELGHFVYHMLFYIFFARLHSFVEMEAGVESRVAERLTAEWQQAYYRTTELRADLTASYFVVPVGAAGSWIENHFSDKPLTPDSQEYIWLKRLEEENPQLSGERINRYLEDAQQAIQKIQAADYDPHAPLFERVAWCTYHRSKRDLQAELERQEAEIQSLFDEFEQSFQESPSPRRATAKQPGERLYRRVAPDKVQAVFWSEEMWDPVIVEHEAKSIQGYIGLIPRWQPRDRWESIDWVVSFEPYEGAPGDLKTWEEIAERHGMGLMLYPLNPLERTVRRMREEMPSVDNLLNYLQSQLRDAEGDTTAEEDENG